MAGTPYGAWPSPVTATLVAHSGLTLSAPALDGGDAYWLEGRPLEGGRSVLVRLGQDGGRGDVTAADVNVRTRVHEYGGGAYTVRGSDVAYVDFHDQRLYLQRSGGLAEPLIATGTGWRFADMRLDPVRDRLVAVGERHGDDGAVENSIVSLGLTGLHDPVELVGGEDFFSSPRLSPDGGRLAWLSWNHPNMPWDGTVLQVAPVLADGRIGKATVIAGGEDESIMQPEWSPGGVLWFISDRTGWWNLYRADGGDVEPVVRMQAEIGEPAWVFGQSAYTFAGEDVVFVAGEPTGSRLYRLAAGSTTPKLVPLPWNWIGPWVQSDGTDILLLAGSATEQPLLARVPLQGGDVRVLQRSTSVAIDLGHISVAEPIEFPSEGGTAHALYYAPRNDDIVAPTGDLPPLLVHSHGGPTAAAHRPLDPKIQFFTSRGIAVVDVDYGGSTGYGRAYRNRLRGRWGIVDVDDCVAAARFLVARGDVDGARLAISGGSAGGYTTLAALTFRDVFAVGASHFGVADLEALARDTHKFEARYLDRLVAPYPAGVDIYRERSPVYHAEQLSCPVILLQGLEDEVVPPAQALAMLAALRVREIPCAYVPFEGEQHGFRRAENIIRALEAELYFYGRILGFVPADVIEPVQIENL